MFSKSIKESISQETNQGLLAIAAHYLALPLIVAATAGHNQGYGRGQQTTDMIHAELHLHNQVPTICNLSAMHLSRLHSNMGHVKWRTGACLLFGQELSGDPLWIPGPTASPHFVFFLIFLHNQQLSSTNSSVAFQLNLNRPRDSRCCDSWDMRDEDGKCYFATLQMNEECYCQPEPA